MEGGTKQLEQDGPAIWRLLAVLYCVHGELK